MNRSLHPPALALWLAFFAASATACERPSLTSPSRLQTVADLQPTITWQGQPSERYRVQVAVVLPEARVLALHDAEVTGTHWRLPEPLAAPHASVKVLVSRQCPGIDTQDLLAQGPWFFVDLRAGCAIDPQRLEATASGLRWAPVAQAQRYSVRTFEAGSNQGDGPLRLSAEHETQEPVWPWSGASTGPQVLSIQAQCQGHWGRPTAWRRP